MDNLVTKANAAIAAKNVKPVISVPTNGSQTTEQRLAALERENAELKALAAERQKAMKIKISEKGAVSVYGLGRFPLSPYRSQWLRLFAYVDTIKQFLVDHDAEITAAENAYNALSDEQKDALKAASKAKMSRVQ